MNTKTDKLQEAAERLNRLLSGPTGTGFPPDRDRAAVERLLSQLSDGDRLLFWWTANSKTESRHVVTRSDELLERIVNGQSDFGDANCAALWLTHCDA